MSVNLPRPERLLLPAHTRSVAGFPGYTIDSLGTVYSKRNGQPLKVRIVRGVPCVDLRPRGQKVSPWVPVHILVARAFVPIPRPLYRHREVIHRDGDRLNCAASNLVWKCDPRRRRELAPSMRERTTSRVG